MTRESTMKTVREAICILAIGALTAAVYGCKEQAQTPVTQPSSPPPTVTTPIPPPATITTSEPSKPKKAAPPWAISRNAQEDSRPTDIKAEWTGGKRLEIHTENVGMLTLDFNKLPEDAPRKGPWTLQIDGQGIEIYGRPGMRVLDLARSRNGDWSVVPDSHRTRP